MGIFGNLHLEEKLQINEKTRLDCSRSFVSNEAAISLMRIKPEASGSFVTVTTDKYLDWAYETAGTKTVTVEITTDGAAHEFTKTIEVVSEADDYLWSSDADLVQHEPDIMNYVPEGKNAFLNIHRLAQTRILAWLDEKKIWDDDNNKLTAAAVAAADMAEWSKYLTLQYIFEGLSNSMDDIFHEKGLRYRALAETAASRAVLRLDIDGDGSTDEKVNNFTGLLLRR
tara:strand:+ start:1567 stop:2247 length:681 start_codon:yes stop_codon:yes gene_type:complete